MSDFGDKMHEMLKRYHRLGSNLLAEVDDSYYFRRIQGKKIVTIGLLIRLCKTIWELFYGNFISVIDQFKKVFITTLTDSIERTL